MSSPLKGIEKISEDLRSERQKANAALQEKARLRVEVESLKQLLESQEKTQQGLLEELEHYKSICHKHDETHSQTNGQLSEMQDQLASKEQEMILMRSEINQCHAESVTLQEALVKRESTVLSLQVQLDRTETEIASRENTIRDFRDEIQQVRDELAKAELRALELSRNLNMKQQEDHNVQSRLKAAEILERNYIQAKESNDSLRNEISALLESNNKLSLQTREISSKYSEKVENEHLLEQTIAEISRERDLLAKEANDWNLTKEELLGQIQAEAVAAEAARERYKMIKSLSSHV